MAVGSGLMGAASQGSVRPVAGVPAGVGSSVPVVFAAGAGIGVVGGLIGLGGAEFRLPLLIGVFGFVALHAVVLNKAMSLVVVATALPARLVVLPYSDVAAHWSVAVNLLAGSLVGAWVGAGWATRMRSRTLYRVLAGLLVLMAIALAASHIGPLGSLSLPPIARVVAAVVAGVGIGVVAALMGVAGGELLIPTIVLLFAVDIKIAGSLSLVVSLPTMLVAFARYSRDQSFQVVRDNPRFLLVMAAGSVVGTVIGGLLLGVVPSVALIPVLVLLLVVSAVKVWRHR
ncbi:sulfite exporter TauE/SafE family protein [Nocardia sp. XZ_19_369]|uniref:sulfite exporter TauE/SafE family protein n=1 Tax=Nocardia sp. XZ_19_369 TaxID=2769487 RepID=UPI0027D2D1BD|nr:sulfite exporter TauE/SafE family protein [Nocardia sp. XZ_19_369]